VKISKMVVKDPRTGQAVMELEGLDLPVSELAELIKEGVISQVKSAFQT
jgi:hypothetical protein